MRTFRTVQALAVFAPLVMFAAAPIPAAHAATRVLETSLLPAPVTRQVEIDGRFVTVELQIIRTIPGAPSPVPNITTRVDVNLRISDGAPLPEGLKAVGVRFEKLRGIKRFFFTPLTEIQAMPFGFEEDLMAYTGDLSDRRDVKFLKAVVRLEVGSEVIKVNMGRVAVGMLALP